MQGVEKPNQGGQRLSLVHDMPGHPWTTEGFAVTHFLHIGGFSFWAGFGKGAGGGGGQGEALVHC